MKIRLEESRGTLLSVRCPRTEKVVKVNGYRCKCESCAHYGGTFHPHMSCRYLERSANGTLHLFEK